MELDWTEVQELSKPSPSYSELIKRLFEVFSYEFVRRHYDHTMSQAYAYAQKLLGEDTRGRYDDRLARLLLTMQRLEAIGILSYHDYVRRVATMEKLEIFWSGMDLPDLSHQEWLRDLIGLLQYLLHWVLPARLSLKELIDDLPEHETYVLTLLPARIRYTLDLLHHAGSRQGRAALARATSIPESFLYDLVNRADLARLPNTRGTTVKNYCHAGYDTMLKLATADLETLSADMSRYGESIGKKLKRSLEWENHLRVARLLPPLVEGPL